MTNCADIQIQTETVIKEVQTLRMLLKDFCDLRQIELDKQIGEMSITEVVKFGRFVSKIGLPAPVPGGENFEDPVTK